MPCIFCNKTDHLNYFCPNNDNFSTLQIYIKYDCMKKIDSYIIDNNQKNDIYEKIKNIINLLDEKTRMNILMKLCIIYCCGTRINKIYYQDEENLLVYMTLVINCIKQFYIDYKTIPNSEERIMICFKISNFVIKRIRKNIFINELKNVANLTEPNTSLLEKIKMPDVNLMNNIYQLILMFGCDDLISRTTRQQEKDSTYNIEEKEKIQYYQNIITNNIKKENQFSFRNLRLNYEENGLLSVPTGRDIDLTCGICLSNEIKIKTNCNHHMCDKCYDNIVNIKFIKQNYKSIHFNCPFCRNAIDTITFSSREIFEINVQNLIQ